MNRNKYQVELNIVAKTCENITSDHHVHIKISSRISHRYQLFCVEICS